MDPEALKRLSFPKEFVLRLYRDLLPEQLQERMQLLDDFEKEHAGKTDPLVLSVKLNELRGFVHWEAGEFAAGAEYYLRALLPLPVEANPSLYFHSLWMAARCFRLAKQFAQSEEWFLKGFAQAPHIASVFDLLVLLAEYVDLLNEENRELPQEYRRHIQRCIDEIGIEMEEQPAHPNELVAQLKRLHHQANIAFSRLVLDERKENREAMIPKWEAYAAGCKVRYYRDLAQERLEKMRKT